MKPEQRLWLALRKVLRGRGHFERVENMVGSGLPDVNYCIASVEGWIELKSVEAWPVRVTTPVQIDHYTDQQRRWALHRTMVGGRVFWLVRSESNSEYVMLRGSEAAKLYASDASAPTVEQLRSAAVWRREGTLRAVDGSVLATALIS